MAATRVKTTYSLDPETIDMLDGLARRWDVSRSEALRRAIRIATDDDGAAPHPGLQALDRLQASLRLTAAAADEWMKSAHDERRATSAHRQGESW